ncbi:hypothetical protein C8R45DRAFT_1016895 [Mycena sanguinolenta]|nr:hypothetical protein C8R45DRAFT_1016895 [Mycena sanguinolenta]
MLARDLAGLFLTSLPFRLRSNSNGGFCARSGEYIHEAKLKTHQTLAYSMIFRVNYCVEGFGQRKGWKVVFDAVNDPRLLI